MCRDGERADSQRLKGEVPPGEGSMEVTRLATITISGDLACDGSASSRGGHIRRMYAGASYD